MAGTSFRGVRPPWEQRHQRGAVSRAGRQGASSGIQGSRSACSLQTFTACRREMSGVRVVTQPPEESPAMASPGPLGGDLHDGGHGIR